MEDDLDIIATRLLGQEQELFGVYDRLKAESEFRIAITVPVMTLIVILLRSSLTLLGATTLDE